MDFKQLLTQLNILEETAVLNKPVGSHWFSDQVRGTERARSISVLNNPDGPPPHPFTGRLVGSAEESTEHPEQSVSDQDLVEQLTREFTEYTQLEGKLKTKAEIQDTPEKRQQQGRCIDCGADLRVTGRGLAGYCKECSADYTAEHGIREGVWNF
jgi:hypothetical protein